MGRLTLETFREAVAVQGWKMTPQRIAIVEYVAETGATTAAVTVIETVVATAFVPPVGVNLTTYVPTVVGAVVALP